jgi:large subunit ribosomal protein L17
MRHKKAGVKLNRTTSHRQAMFRNMVTSLFKYERIRTTDVKAKELRRWADHIITLAKRGDLHARRQVLSIVREKNVAHKLFAEVDERFGNLNGGYTRIVKIGLRAGDAAPISLIELVALEGAAPKDKKKSQAPGKKKTTAAPSSKPVEKQVDQIPPAAPVTPENQVKAQDTAEVASAKSEASDAEAQEHFPANEEAEPKKE